MFVFRLLLSRMPETVQRTYQRYVYGRQTKDASFSSHYAKEQLIDTYAKKYSIDTFVETGTYLGDMVWTQRNNFRKIYSIELGKKLAKFSKDRFKHSKKIEILQGDSGLLLQKLVPELTTKALFYLDAHYSGENSVRGHKDTPVSEELKSILKSNFENVIIINDAHAFIGERDYPTQEGIRNYILNKYPYSIINIENNCIVILLIHAKEIEKDNNI